jgi:glycerol-3-phosphate acyltransferase PlsY
MKWRWAITGYLALLLWLVWEEYKSAADKPHVLYVAVLVFILHLLGLWLALSWRTNKDGKRSN